MDRRTRRPPVKQEMITCATCQQEMAVDAFAGHNADEHHMLGWIEGTEPLDLQNEKLVLSILNKALKVKKKKSFRCHICCDERKSAVGFFGHLQVCGKTAEEKEQLRVSCEICGKSMMPVSLRPHMLEHQRKSEAAIEVVEEDSQGRKPKRAAATKAKSRMSDFLSADMFPPGPNQAQLYSDMEYPGWYSSSPKLIETWLEFIRHTGGISCFYKGCSFRADSVESIQKHLGTCGLYKSHDQRFVCNVCFLQRMEESDIAAHVEADHNSRGSDESADVSSESERHFSSDEGESPQQLGRRQSRLTVQAKAHGPQRAFTKLKFLQNTVSSLGKDLEIYPGALNWTFDFRLANYAECVFPALKPMKVAFKLVEESAKTFLPNTPCSVSLELKGTSKHSESPKTLSLFEGQILDDVSTFFTGGPVWAMEWCPIPMKVCLKEDCTPVDYLAISTHHNMDDTFFVSKCYSFPNIIQFWDCGLLSIDRIHRPPKLALALAHNYGTLWSLAWCPSGAYESDFQRESSNEEESHKRMGLLAAACSSGNVEIFSIPFPDLLKDHVDKRVLPVYKAEPALSLINDFSEPSQCTRVTWYQGRGHGLVAGGFCNGMVAIWDLITLPPLLYDDKNRTLRPFQSFQAHSTVISALSFNPEFEGRFFMTGSHDRSIKFWDMEDLSAPMTHHRRGYVTDGVWLNLWVSSVTSYDDAFQHEHTNSTLHPVRDFGYKPYPLLTQNSVAWCLSYNDWINATAQGSEAGEIVVTFSSQLMLGLENEKSAIEKRMMTSYTLLKKLEQDEKGQKKLGEVVLWKPEPKQATKPKGKKSSKTSKVKAKSSMVEDEVNESASEVHVQERNPQFYADIAKNFGICLHDTVKGNTDRNKIPADAKSRVRLSGKMHPTCSDFYPITSINKVAWNPNIGRYFWLASGYQCGLVRITGMHFMHNINSKRFLIRAAQVLFSSESN